MAAQRVVPSRTGVLVRLRFRVLGNTLRRHPWQLVGVIIGALYGLFLLGAALIGLVALGLTGNEYTGTILIVAGSLIVLGWVVGPLFLGGDRPLAPERFVAFPIPDAELRRGILLAALLGVPGIVTAIVALATALAWLQHPLALIAALVLAPVAVLTCLLAAQIIGTATAALAQGRRFKEIVGTLVLIVFIVGIPLFSLLLSGGGTFVFTFEAVPAIAQVLAWTPLGAVWAIPADIAAGAWLLAGARLLIALATGAALALLWRRLFTTVPVQVRERGAKGATGAGVFGWFPVTPTGAIAARSLIYWFRDPRYARQLLTVPLFPVIFVLLSLFNGDGGALVIFGCVFGALLGAMAIYTDLSYDGTAFVTEQARAVPGRVDRAGRAWAAAYVLLPIAVLLPILPAWVMGRGDVYLPVLGMSVGVTLAGLAVSSVSSAIVVMPVPDATDSPFASKPGAGMISMLATFAVMGVTGALSIPVVIVGILAITSGSVALSLVAVAVGAGLGALWLWLGIRQGGKTLDRRAPELLVQLAKAQAS